MWYYFCCKLQLFPGLYSDALQTTPGILAPVEQQALDSARQLRCLRTELLGGAGALWSS